MSVQLSPEQVEQLESLAVRRQLSVAAVVREAVRGYLAQAGQQLEAVA